MLLHLKAGDGDLLRITEPALLTKCAWQSHSIKSCSPTLLHGIRGTFLMGRLLTYRLGLDQNIRLFEYSFGGLAFDFQFWDSNFEYPFFFFGTPGIPREMVLNLSAWLNICTSNRPFANERRSCWPIACIYFMKNLLLWVRLPHIYIWNNELKRAKDATCERTLCYHKTECDACVFFLSTVRDASESLVSACSSSCSEDELLMWSRFERVKERRRGPAESLTLFSNDWFNLLVCVDLLI